MRWAQRLKRVFGIDIEICTAFVGAMRIIACIEDSVVIKTILALLAGKSAPGARTAVAARAGMKRFTQ